MLMRKKCKHRSVLKVINCSFRNKFFNCSFQNKLFFVVLLQRIKGEFFFSRFCNRKFSNS